MHAMLAGLLHVEALQAQHAVTVLDFLSSQKKNVPGLLTLQYFRAFSLSPDDFATKNLTKT